jgi:hypothetical protein
MVNTSMVSNGSSIILQRRLHQRVAPDRPGTMLAGPLRQRKGANFKRGVDTDDT